MFGQVVVTAAAVDAEDISGFLGVHRLKPCLAFRARRLLADFAARGISLKGSNQPCPNVSFCALSCQSS
jgi:hypothetical protein